MSRTTMDERETSDCLV